MIDVYRNGLSRLLEFREFMVLYTALRYGLLLLIVALLMVALLHILYVLGFNSPLYKRKSPARGWGKRFAVALLSLLVIIAAYYWLLTYLQNELT